MSSDRGFAQPKINMAPRGPDVGEYVQCYCGAHVLLFLDGHKEEWQNGRRPHRCTAPWQDDDEYTIARQEAPVTRGEAERGLEHIATVLDRILVELQRLSMRGAGPPPPPGAPPKAPDAERGIPQGNQLELE